MTPLLLLASLLAADPAPEAVELKTPTGTLHGSLDLPDGKGPWPVVLIHAGSGPTDRDGNGPATKSDNLKMLGQGLATQGLACLRIDKRAIGKSRAAGLKEEDLRLTTYSDDVVLWVKWLRADKRFGKVGFIGHSEGSLIGTLATDAKFDAFVSLCGPGRKLGVVIREQLQKNAPKELAAKADAILTELEAGRGVEEVPKELVALFRPSVQPYLISMVKPDPAKVFGELECPALVVSGTTDIQVGEADSNALLAARKGATGVRIKGMNHVLKEVAGTHLLLQDASYKDPKLPLHPKLLDELAGFLGKGLK